MALEPIDIAFRNAPAARTESGGLGPPQLNINDEPSSDDINRFRIGMGEMGDARPADRVWGMISGWNEAVKTEMHTMAAALNRVEPLTELELLSLQVKSHGITLTQSIMAKVGSSLNDASNALLRGQ